MDETVRTILISTSISVLGAIITMVVTKIFERRSERANNSEKSIGDLTLAKFGQEENIRKEMQVKIERLERMVDRQERAFGTLRDSVNDMLRDTLVTMQMAIHELKDGHPDRALARLEEGVKRLANFKVPELPPIEETK